MFRERKINLAFINSFLLMGGTPLIMLLVFNFIGFEVSTVFVVITKLTSFFLTLISLLKVKGNVKNDIVINLFILFGFLWFCRVFYDGYFNLNFKLKFSVLDYYLFFLFFSFVPFLFGFIIKDNNTIYQVEKGVVASNSIFSIVTFIIYFSFLSNVKRLGAEEQSVNPLVISYIAAMNIGYFVLRGMLKSFNIYAVILIFINLTLLGLGASKGSVVALVISLLLTLIIIKKINLKLFLLFILFFLLFTFFNFTFFDVLIDRFNFSIQANINDEKELRYYLWQEGINKFIDSPFVGYYTEISERNLSILDVATYPHNIIIESFYSLGIIGGLLLLGLILITVKRGIWVIRRKVEESWLLLFFFIAFYQNLFSGNIYSGSLWFWFMMGVINGRYIFLKCNLYQNKIFRNG